SSGVALVWQTGPAHRHITGQTTSTRNYAGAVELHRVGLQTELSTFDLEAENYMVVASKV
ncbi:hypothetical protein ACIF9R_14640, partial [Streptomyces sp. NPDC086080]